MTVRKIGNATIEKVEEICGAGFKPGRMFPKFNQEAFDAQKGWMVPDHVEPGSDRLVGSIHTWIVKTGRHTILIDTCLGNHKQRTNPGWRNLDTPFLNRLKACGCDPNSVDLVMCTHLHVDHVGWNTKLENGKWVPTFPNAKYVMSRTDHDHWEALAKKPDTEPYQVNTYNDSVLPIVEARKAEFVSGEHGMCDCLTLKPAPGHTPGQIRVDLESRGKRAIFPGDALHNPVQVPLWKWNSRFCDDRDLARKTRNRLLGDCVEQGALLMPAHFAPPHAAYVKVKGERFELDWDYDNVRGR